MATLKITCDETSYKYLLKIVVVRCVYKLPRSSNNNHAYPQKARRVNISQSQSDVTIHFFTMNCVGHMKVTHTYTLLGKGKQETSVCTRNVLDL